MPRYKVKNKDAKIHVKVSLQNGESLIEREISMMLQKSLRGLLKPEILKNDVLEYTGPQAIALSEYLLSPHEAYDFYYIMAQVIRLERRIAGNGLSIKNLVVDLRNVFINPNTREVQMLYLPLSSGQAGMNIWLFLESIAFSWHPDPAEGNRYISDFVFFLRGLPSYQPEEILEFITKSNREVAAVLRATKTTASGFITNKKTDYYQHYSQGTSQPEQQPQPQPQYSAPQSQPQLQYSAQQPQMQYQPQPPVQMQFQPQSFGGDETDVLMEDNTISVAPVHESPSYPQFNPTSYRQDPAPSFPQSSPAPYPQSAPTVSPQNQTPSYPQSNPAAYSQGNSAFSSRYNSPSVPQNSPPAAPKNPFALSQTEAFDRPTETLNEDVDQWNVDIGADSYQEEGTSGLFDDVRSVYSSRKPHEGEGTVVLSGELNRPPARKYPYLIRRNSNERIVVNKPVFRIGKERSYVDYFVANNPAISRSHADIIIRGDRYFVCDRNSTNKTYKNGYILTPEDEVEILNGDVIQLANEEFVFHIE